MRWTKVTKNVKKTINGVPTIVPTKVVNDGLVARRVKEAEMFARVLIVEQDDEEDVSTLLG